MPVIAAIVVGVVAAGTAIGTSIAKNNAAHKASGARKQALAEQKEIVPTGDNSEAGKAKAQDIQHYTDSYATFAKMNPELAAARTTAEKNLNQAVGQNFGQAQGVLDQAITEATAPSKEISLADQVVNTAQRALAQGSRLDPSYQAELIRAGLEQAGTTGVGTDRTGALSQRLGTLLGTAGEQLKSKRLAEASAAADAGAKLKAQRSAILQGLTNTSTGLQTAKLSANGQVVSGIDSMVPSIGLSGADVVKMDLANLAAQNQRKIAQGELKAADAQAQAELVAGILGGINSGVQSASGAYGQFGGGSGGGGGSMPSFSMPATSSSAQIPYQPAGQPISYAMTAQEQLAPLQQRYVSQAQTNNLGGYPLYF
jgi:hypothetical protein